MYKKGDRIKLQITDMGKDGEGIGKIDTFPFFVKDALIGDTIEAAVMKAKRTTPLQSFYGYLSLLPTG